MQREPFKEFEYLAWQRAAEHYEHYFAPLTNQTVGPLLDAVEAGSNKALLDVASGPGYVTAAAAQRGARATGVDFSEAMVAKAKRLHPNLNFTFGDAEQLPFGDSEFDAIVMNFGILHLAQPEMAIREVYRVLRHKGRFAFAVWAKPEEAVGFAIALRAVEAFGNSNIALPQGPPFFRFSDSDECTKVLDASKFVDVEVEQFPLIWELTSTTDLFDAFYRGSARMGGLLRAQSKMALTAIREAIHRSVAPYEQNGRLAIPMPARVVRAQKL
jgi:ubiquinone/menaquinone biosynthesis C-methylase UbiE